MCLFRQKVEGYKQNPIDLVDLDKTNSLKDAVKEKENSSCKDKNHTQGHNDLNMDQNRTYNS